MSFFATFRLFANLKRRLHRLHSFTCASTLPRASAWVRRLFLCASKSIDRVAYLLSDLPETERSFRRLRQPSCSSQSIHLWNGWWSSRLQGRRGRSCVALGFPTTSLKLLSCRRPDQQDHAQWTSGRPRCEHWLCQKATGAFRRRAGYALHMVNYSK